MQFIVQYIMNQNNNNLILIYLCFVVSAEFYYYIRRYVYCMLLQLTIFTSCAIFMSEIIIIIYERDIFDMFCMIYSFEIFLDKICVKFHYNRVDAMQILIKKDRSKYLKKIIIYNILRLCTAMIFRHCYQSAILFLQYPSIIIFFD